MCFGTCRIASRLQDKMSIHDSFKSFSLTKWDRLCDNALVKTQDWCDTEKIFDYT